MNAAFNVDDQGTITIRKASSHGLGHLQPPDKAEDEAENKEAASIGIRPWQLRFWLRIIESYRANGGEPVDLSDLHGFDRPAATQFSLSQASLLTPFKSMSLDGTYAGSIKPYGFVTRFQGNHLNRKLTPISPYDPDPLIAAEHCVDRKTGEPVAPGQLQTYAEALGMYHLHREPKFENGDLYDFGETRRRHVVVTGVELIGKEADHWQEARESGDESFEVLIKYGFSKIDVDRFPSVVANACETYTARALAAESGITDRELRRIVKLEVVAGAHTIVCVLKGIDVLRREGERGDDEANRCRVELMQTVALLGLAEAAREC